MERDGGDVERDGGDVERGDGDEESDDDVVAQHGDDGLFCFNEENNSQNWYKEKTYEELCGGGGVEGCGDDDGL